MAALEQTADRQAIWSSTANVLKKRLENIRWLTLAFSILGALLATIASQLDEGDTRLYTAIVAAVMFAVVAFLSARFLSKDDIAAWIRARAASEALKREAFKHAAQAHPYDDPGTRDKLLIQECERIEDDLDDLLEHVVSAGEAGSAPRQRLTRADYVMTRVEAQAKFYLDRAAAAQKTARKLRMAEFLLALTATILTALVGVAGKTPFGIDFDFVALTAVLTTIAGAILTHIEASRLDTLVATYRATARRLSNELANLGDVAALSAEEWSAFVQRCEGIVSEENNGWIAKWSKPTGQARQ